jgi:hypothetical protein
MCAVALHRRAPLPPDATEGVELSIDVAEPAARHRSRPSQRACEAYDQEAERPLGRRWVKDQMSEGMACQLNDALVSTNLGQLPPRDTIFALSDGERTFPPLLAERAASLLRAEVMHVGDLVSLERLEVGRLAPPHPPPARSPPRPRPPLPASPPPPPLPAHALAPTRMPSTTLAAALEWLSRPHGLTPPLPLAIPFLR